ncbi:TPM domain-containing protein [Nitrosophilus alvini]|uniref:TPM domain-containing protein n=1 Tax=Nitrosophilus alvini TaxID=2714855 RepID=UPI00190D6B67|nr:TPM domain-containing protein [Nitrosophilus alvini]
MAPFLFFLLTGFLNASDFILKNDNILPEKTVMKIDEMGKELQEKTGVSVYIVAVNHISGTNFKEYEENVSKSLKPPFILLTIALNDKKIDIISSDDVKSRFDKETVLSPLPWKGSILPLLTQEKGGKANVQAALLNGYADIVDQVSSSYGVELASSVGSDNRYVYDVLKLFFYGTIILILIRYLYGRFAKK